MIALFYIVLIIGLAYSFKISTWARQARLGFNYYSPAIFISYHKTSYVFRWIFILGVTGLSITEQVDWPIWLVPLLFVINVWIGRQYAAFHLSRKFREDYRNGNFINDPDTGEPMTPEELLKVAYETEKHAIRGWKYLGD